MTQPGYDALADLYVELFPDPYLTPLERHTVAAFAEMVCQSQVQGVVLDVGCGPGYVAADLADRGLDVIGLDPSTEMLRIARGAYPALRFVRDDARLGSDDLRGVVPSAIIARFSLIHVPPLEIPRVLAGWAERIPPGGVVLVAGQTTDEPGEVVEFDHAVAPAWRWHPDRLAAALSDAGFDEVWRTVGRPDADHRFPDVHLAARRR
ncbi:methyltransferase type 11 [Rhodococcus sp. 852002-51564_SCH6189132-a]|uniref:class I SAM-dependent methyltransferase n=1 Tax=Rhodococcus sp. 852002-51564_SCH6189132-a TaxID=1834103 RepID=UPI0007E9F7B4|nr:class I SAM-dependent methyltransferase [Rhodococcus sp. 852002-51564_SCH6189132-a]OBA32838.1 methyltransferase type 11 [Rhodococcus sp. 852002-51564_SCH6189132-a]